MNGDASPRVRLRALHERDGDLVHDPASAWGTNAPAVPRRAPGPAKDTLWLAEAVAALDGVKPDAGTPAAPAEVSTWAQARWPGVRLAWIEAGGAQVGLLGWQEDTLGVVIVALAVRAEQRNLGIGAEAVFRLEEERPGARCYAAVPRTNGLAVYFWLRSGYRPVRVEESVARATDPAALWMVREPSSGSSGGACS